MLILPTVLLLQAPAPRPDPLPPARIELTTPFPVHLGSVGPREVREAVFGVRSTHDRPFHLRVLDLSLGLSFDGAQLAEPLKPGEVRMLRVRVDPSGLEGAVKGALRLGTDDPAQPTYILRCDLVVRPEVAVDGERKTFGEVAPHESPELRFHFTREGGEPLRLSLASDLPPYLEATLIPLEAAADLRLTLRPRLFRPGATAGMEVLRVATNGPRQPLFTLYVDWRLATPVIPTPSRLVFTDAKTPWQSLVLTARDGKPFRILRAEVQGGGFELLDRPEGEAARQVLRVRRLGHHAEAMLVLVCSNQDLPLKVPLRDLDPAVAGP